MIKDNHPPQKTLKPDSRAATGLGQEGYCLYELLEASVFRHSAMASSRDIQLACSIHPALPSRLQLEKGMISQALSDITHFFLCHYPAGKLSLQLKPHEDNSIDPGQKLRLQFRFQSQSAEYQLRPGILPQLNRQLLAYEESFRQIGGYLERQNESTHCLVLPYQTIADQFEHHDCPSAAIILYTENPDSGTLLCRLLSEISPTVHHTSNRNELQKLLSVTAMIGLVVLDLSHTGQDYSALRPTFERLRKTGLPVLLLHNEMQTDHPPAHWQRLALPIRKKGLLRVALRQIRGYLKTNRNSSRHVLVVEDHHINQKVISKLLTHLQIDYALTSEGAAAIEAFTASAAELILMDIHMPGMDGFETTRQIRQLNQLGAKVPIIAMTADTLDETKQACRAAGFTDFLQKPLDLEALQGCLQRYLYAQQAPLQSPAIEPAPHRALQQTLMQELLKILPHYRDLLLSTAQQDDVKTIADTAHSIAGAAAYCAADELKQAAMALETSVRSRPGKDRSQRLEDLLQLINEMLSD